MILGSLFIIGMTLISARGIVVSEIFLNILMGIQFVMLILVSIWALDAGIRGKCGSAGGHAQWDWLWPSGLSRSQIAAALILCIFIYWGWDACLAVGEETKTRRAPLVSPR